MRRCQVFNIFAGVSVPSFAVKPGMLFLRWFVRKGSIAWVPWSISFTFVACSVHGESATFLTPAAGERHGGRFARPPCPPGIALKTAAARYAPLRLHLAEASLTGRWPLAVPQQPDGGDKGIASRRFSCRNAGFPGPGETGPGSFACRAGNSSVRNLT